MLPEIEAFALDFGADAQARHRLGDEDRDHRADAGPDDRRHDRLELHEKLVRHVRTLNASAKIVSTADMLASINDLYAAGADYVTVPRLTDAQELFKWIAAVDNCLLDEKRAEIDAQLAERREVLP